MPSYTRNQFSIIDIDVINHDAVKEYADVIIYKRCDPGLNYHRIPARENLLRPVPCLPNLVGRGIEHK
jgi:hypothetical protein